MDLNDLRAKAEACGTDEIACYGNDIHTELGIATSERDRLALLDTDDLPFYWMRFMAAANPQAVIELLAEVERLRSENAQLNEIVQRAMLHAARQEVKYDEIRQNLNTILNQLGIKPTDAP